MNFEFNARYERRPSKLSGPMPYMHPDMRPRVAHALEQGCGCNHDSDRTATLRRRISAAGSVTIWLQCDACGGGLGSALARQQHPGWQDYPEWDYALVMAYEKARETWRAALPTIEDMRAQREAEYIARSQEYEEWCRTSPEWDAIKKRVAWRSRGHCEACLSGTAEIVHHLTYTFGKLPPAWHLRAVCRACHDRLHTSHDEWCDYGMAR